MVAVTLSPLAKQHCERTGATMFDLIGFVFTGLSPDASGTAVEQLDRHYQHGGGWRPLQGFTVAIKKPVELNDELEAFLEYAGDPDMRLIAWAKLRDELIMLFEGSWVCVRQPNGSIVVARMD